MRYYKYQSLAPQEEPNHTDHLLHRQSYSYLWSDPDPWTRQLTETQRVIQQHLATEIVATPSEKRVFVGEDARMSLPIQSALRETQKDLWVIWLVRELPKVQGDPILPALCGADSSLKVSHPSTQTMILGLSELSELEEHFLQEQMIPFYSMEDWREKGVLELIQDVQEMVSGSPLHLVLDMSVLNPTVIPDWGQEPGLNYEELGQVMTTLAPSAVSMELIGYDADRTPESRIRSMMTEVQRKMISLLMQVPEKSLNIFTEESEFLVFRPLEMKDEADDGWYILRGVPLELKKELMSWIPRDSIQTLELPSISLADSPTSSEEEVDYLITKTTIQEQNQKSYYHDHTLLDVVLFPQEKNMMMFELVTSYPQSSEPSSLSEPELAPAPGLEPRESSSLLS